MYKLQRLNVVRIADDENKKDKYIKQGFELIEEGKDAEAKKDKAEKPVSYSEMTVEGLRGLCKDNGLTGYSDLKRDDLIKFVEENLKK